jgi:hypothetical protein
MEEFSVGLLPVAAGGREMQKTQQVRGKGETERFLQPGMRTDESKFEMERTHDS